MMTLVRNQPLAEEITQNTFYRAMTSKKTFAQRSGELTWLCSIAKHLAADEYRKTGKTAELDEAAAVSGGQDPADAVEDKETALQIHLILHDLPEPYKEVFQLRVFGELPFSQIGFIFGKTENWPGSLTTVQE